MKNSTNNLYLHADGDSFFVACELSVNPQLRGRPVIVGGDRGIAVAMSMEAKKLGVTRGMPVFKIKRLFPEVVILPHHFDLYVDISSKMHRILSSYFTKVEVYSIDECFALVHPSEIKYFGDERKLLAELKNEIEKTLKVTYSLGLARTKSLSKLASKLEKPGGSVILLSKEDEALALQATSIEDIWGVGKRTSPALLRLGAKTAYDFINLSDSKLIRGFSKPILVFKKELTGEQVLEVKHDADPRNQKSIQSTSTFRPASADPKIIYRELAENTEQACRNAREIHLVSNKMSFFVKTSEFKYYFDEFKLEEFTADPGTILNALEPRLPKLLKKRDQIRSTGVILHDLIKEEVAPLDLFGRQKRALGRLAIEETADEIRKKYGHNAIKRGASHKGKGF